MRLMAILAIMTATMTSPSSQGNPWLASGRCGSQNLLSDGKPGQCDPNGWANEVGPCCSKWGWCGNSADHCDCAECIDYRQTSAGKLRHARKQFLKCIFFLWEHENSDFENCPANGKYPNTDVYCLNEDDSTNCLTDSDCPNREDKCGFVENCYDDCDEIELTWKCGKPPSRGLCVCYKNGKKMEKSISSCDECEPSCTCKIEAGAFNALFVEATTATIAQSFSGSRGFGVISNRCPATRPCPYRDGKCGRVVGLGRGGRRAACPRRRF